MRGDWLAGARRGFLSTLLAFTAVSVSGCTSSKEYADRGAGGAAGASESEGGAGAPSGGNGGSSGSGGNGSSNDSGGNGGDNDSGGNGGNATATDAGGSAGSGGEAGAPGYGGSSTSEQCGEGSDDAPCGERLCDTAFGECTADDVCALTGQVNRTCTEWRCQAGKCRLTEVTDTAPCERNPEGVTCRAPECTEWGACSYDSTCTNSGTRTRTCTTYSCAAGACQAEQKEEPDSAGCARNTDGDPCGSGSCGSCGYANGCDTQSDKWCYEYVCGGGTCNENGYSSSYGCPSRAIECSPGTTQTCSVPDEDVCNGAPGYCTGSKTCSDSCTWNACMRVAGGCFC